MSIHFIIESNLRFVLSNFCDVSEEYFRSEKEYFQIEYFQIGKGKNGEEPYELHCSNYQTNKMSVILTFPIYISPKTSEDAITLIQNKLYDMIDNEIINWSQHQELLKRPLKHQDINGDPPKKVQIGKAPVFKLKKNRKFDLILN
ncbi:hypothetical protein [Anabaena sp. AL93]|uniref:hypothetical protein n=1 Tax=Anabaena sp. AL93 TaxID=1678133 RepID=UPI0007FEF151|nr:hypothetical protein [Anabaena sp. AL93]OBQ18624.1 MAG: hypothetical protein AN486_11585 [Anabaena sp. AL93]